MTKANNSYSIYQGLNSQHARFNAPFHYNIFLISCHGSLTAHTTLDVIKKQKRISTFNARNTESDKKYQCLY